MQRRYQRLDRPRMTRMQRICAAKAAAYPAPFVSQRSQLLPGALITRSVMATLVPPVPDCAIRGPFMGHHARTARRAGFNLIELLFAVSAISALSVLTMTVIAMLMTAEQHAAEGLWIDVTVANLADELRSDAHPAIGMEATPDVDGSVAKVILTQPGDVRVVYECTADGVTRQQLQDEKVIATETYRLALGTSTFVPPGDDGLLTWTHTRGIPSIGGLADAQTNAAAPQRTYQIVTAVGLHKPLSGEGGE